MLLPAIDGDGMVCAVTFQDGCVHFRSKFVNSEHRKEESEKKKFIYRGQMGTKPATSPFKYLISALMRPRVTFRNPSNTNSFYWGGKVLHLFIYIWFMVGPLTRYGCTWKVAKQEKKCKSHRR